jgi:hypothetical protein
MDIAALYRELDPLRPLEADPAGDALYVDWQGQAEHTADVKSRLVRAFVRNAAPEHPITRLLTGHPGSGKTTELNRVARSLQTGTGGKRVFVSKLFALQWLDVEDLQPEDLVLQIVRQLVSDLRDAGMSLGAQRFTGFLTSLLERVRLDVDLGIDPLTFSFKLEDYPSEREKFRQVLRGRLPTVFDLVNRDLLPAARDHLRKQGFDDILLIVDDLDKIPRKPLGDHPVTNQENLFLDNAGMLRAVHCSVLMTIPIDLAYSPAQGRLRNDYGSSISTVPLISVMRRDGSPDPAGEAALVEILGRRARVAFGVPGTDPASCAAAIFEDHDLLLRLVRLSGGHVRSLLVLLTELLDWVDTLPLDRRTVERFVPRAAKDLARALFTADKELLRQLDATKEAVEDTRFFDLLKNHYVFAYEAGLDDYWYGLNPLLHEIEL